MEAAFGLGFGIIIAIFAVVLSLAVFAVWIWTIIDVVKVPSDDRFRAGNQLVWILVIVLTQIIGSIIYLAVGRPEPGRRR